MSLSSTALSEQTQFHTDIPFDAGVQAAHAWFTETKASAATHRDNARCALVRSIADDSEASAASTMFKRGFAHGLAQAIAGGAHHG